MCSGLTGKFVVTEVAVELRLWMGSSQKENSGTINASGNFVMLLSYDSKTEEIDRFKCF